jgi:hypothetical protein
VLAAHRFTDVLHYEVLPDAEGFVALCSCGWTGAPVEDERQLPWQQTVHIASVIGGPPVRLSREVSFELTELLAIAAGAVDNTAEDQAATLDGAVRVLASCLGCCGRVQVPPAVLAEVLVAASDAVATLRRDPVCLEVADALERAVESLMPLLGSAHA